MKHLILFTTTVLLSSAVLAGGGLFGGGDHSKNPNGVKSIAVELCGVDKCPEFRMIESECTDENSYEQFGTCFCKAGFVPVNGKCEACPEGECSDVQHKANEILNAASVRAMVVSTQIQNGSSSPTLAEFTDNKVAGATFGTDVKNTAGTGAWVKGTDTKFSLTLSGVDSNICGQMENIVSSDSKNPSITCGETTILTYNNDLGNGESVEEELGDKECTSTDLSNCGTGDGDCWTCKDGKCEMDATLCTDPDKPVCVSGICMKNVDCNDDENWDICYGCDSKPCETSKDCCPGSYFCVGFGSNKYCYSDPGNLECKSNIQCKTLDPSTPYCIVGYGCSSMAYDAVCKTDAECEEAGYEVCREISASNSGTAYDYSSGSYEPSGHLGCGGGDEKPCTKHSDCSNYSYTPFCDLGSLPGWAFCQEHYGAGSGDSIYGPCETNEDCVDPENPYCLEVYGYKECYHENDPSIYM